MRTNQLSAHGLRAALAIVCIGSGLIPLLAFETVRPVEQLLALGLPSSAALAVFGLLIMLDLSAGALAIFAPAYVAAIFIAVMTCGYTLVMSVGMPEVWLDPYGAILKNLVILASCAALVDLEKGARLC